MLALPPALHADDAGPASSQADWRRDGVDDRVKAALTGQGWRLEDDGRALDPKTKAPAAKAALDKAVLDLRLGAQRAALETVNLMLATGKPLSPADKDKVSVLSADLPPALTAAILDPKADLKAVKAMADASLSGVSAYFDGGRTLADREAAAQPVAAGQPGPRVDLPYYTAAEKAVGQKLQAAAKATIGKDPFGKTILARLNGKDGKPDLPPIVIEDQNGPVVAQYDIRRRAIVLDREGVLSSVVGAQAPGQRATLRQALSTRAALLAYLDAHPDAIAAVMQDNDVVLAHELTHAWQDRRDPIFREIARGNLPDTQPLEYEEEAYKTKNLYLQSKLANDPASVKADRELTDYTEMLLRRRAWQETIAKDLSDTSPSRALTIDSTAEIQRRRIAAAKLRAVATADEQRAKALDLKAMTRGQRELAALKAAHDARMADLDARIDKSAAGGNKTLGAYYLVQSRFAERSTDRAAFLELAERYAAASGNAALIEEVRKAKESKP